LNYPASHL